jgi:hypothetical protein
MAFSNQWPAMNSLKNNHNNTPEYGTGQKPAAPPRVQGGALVNASFFRYDKPN